MFQNWHVYLIECADGSLYTGITTDVERRFLAHLAGKGARYTRSHKPLRIAASCPVGSRSQALRAELAIKRQPPAKKMATLLSFVYFKSEGNDHIAANRESSVSKATAG